MNCTRTALKPVECTALALAKVKLYHMMLKNVTVQLRLELHWSCTGTALEPVQHWKSCLMTSNDINHLGKCTGTALEPEECADLILFLCDCTETDEAFSTGMVR